MITPNKLKTNLPSIPIKIFEPTGVHKMIKTSKTQKTNLPSIPLKIFEPTRVS